MNRDVLFARRYAFDALIAAVAVEGALEVALRGDAPDGPTTAAWVAAPAIAILAVPLFARRRFPFAAPAAVWILAVSVSYLDNRLVTFTASSTVAGLAAAFLLGNVRDGLRARIGLALVAGCAAVLVYNDPSHSTAQLVFTPILFGVGWLAGVALRERVEQAEAAEERAAHAEREREAAARLAVAEERARIARELHDIVAHAVSVMVLQAGAVRHRLPGDLGEDRDALAEVERAGRSALAEMRRLLGAMRDPAEDAALAPAPGLGAIDALAAGVERAGLPVRVRVEGERVPLPRAVDLSAYRIVQEGLTNSLKHAHATSAEVTVRFARNEIQIEVADDGAGPGASDDRGHGLVGVGERVKIYGGEMSAGPAPGGGFLLRARLPLGAAT